MWAAQVVALNRPEAIRYRAWNRSRVRRCGAPTEASRRSSSVWPHVAISTRIIGRLRGGGWPGCPRSRSYTPTPERKLPVSNGAGFRVRGPPPSGRRQDARHRRPAVRLATPEPVPMARPHLTNLALVAGWLTAVAAGGALLLDRQAAPGGTGTPPP